LMQRRSRLTGNKRFSQIHQEGSSSANRLLVIRFLRNGVEHSRFGFVVSKRIGGAVVRNRVKRRLREAVRTSRVTAGWDAILIARKGSEKVNYRTLKLASNNLLVRHHIVGAASDASQKYPVTDPPG
jgi:ribonuclease P protein component